VTGWQIWIDTGGTFTDCVARDEKGSLHRAKVLSSAALRGTIREVLERDSLRADVSWSVPRGFLRGFQFALLDSPRATGRVASFDPREGVLRLQGRLPAGARAGAAFEVRSPEEAPVLAARLVTGTPSSDTLPEMSMRLATTRATNALLERSGAPTALFITEGFGDLLLIGDQQRPDLFALNVRKPAPLYETVVEVRERMAADGSVLLPLSADEVESIADRLLRGGIRCAAVALVNSYKNPSHEKMLAARLFAHGFEHVSCSSDLAPFIRVVPRAQTAVVNAYLSPVIDGYLRRVRQPLSPRRGGDRAALHVMTSAGGLSEPACYRAKDSLLSGPAGGVVGAARAGRLSGADHIIAFDMGGTSTDVARFDGDYDYTFEHEVGGAHLVAPALAIESVAAGGGSICRFDANELLVGPQSAGASPGPACYGAGGPFTLTDVNLLLGRLDGRRFDIPIDVGAARRACDEMLDGIARATGERPPAEELLEGLCRIADERMADAIRRISIRKGYDPADYALVAFGGAGGQHGCAVAARLGMSKMIVPRDVSLLSALGLGHAAIEQFAERQVLRLLDEVRGQLPLWIDGLCEEAASALERSGIPRDRSEIRRRIVNLRFAGQESVLHIDYDGETPLERAFEEKYRHVFGHWQDDRQIEIESIRVVASSKPEEATGTPPAFPRFPEGEPAPRPSRLVKARFGGRWRDAPCYEREELPPGARFDGPALVFERYSVTVVEEGWRAVVDGAGALVLERPAGREGPVGGADRGRPDLVRLELFTHRFGAVAREMGEMFRRTAVSTNVKERLDFSCAVLDRDGRLVVNAPHIPVHLGSMGLCVRAARRAVEMGPGDVVATNHPRFGGSHLPDVTVISPVHLPDGRLLGYVANRAHHAELGGTRPGSMPPDAVSLAEEGVVIPPTHLFLRGEPRWGAIRHLLETGPYPTRAVEENMADLRAAVAANRDGAAGLLKLAASHGAETVWHFMEALEARADRKLRDALCRIPDGVYEAEERLDDGSPLRVRLHIVRDRVEIDFAGSSGVHPGSFNATPAVVNGAVIYVLRLLVDEPLPLNEGLMRAVTMQIPPGILNPPFPEDPARAPAVVGGNVETSQRLVDTLLKALGLAACSQGTMNNVLFGTDRHSYYETVCGGTGAGPGFDGTDAVHSHMTNTRITDVEVVEHRYPVRIDTFAIRRGSGGRGLHTGGNGVVRAIRFLEAATVSVLGQHRREGPYGLCGGEAGLPARVRVIRADGSQQGLSSVDGFEAAPGDRLVLETPGGGGFGRRPA
jgi:5-oxoprolinase (ATP-hydrolysing)